MAVSGRIYQHETNEYPLAVVSGKVTAGRLVRLACERHLRDLESGHERGLHFDEAAASHAIRFFRLLRFSKGRWAGKVFNPEPWQRFFIGSLFGWKRADGKRRFREGHLEVARKNGKTETAAGIALYLLCGDRENGADVYTLATKKDQAKLTFDCAKSMIAKSPALRKHLRRLKYSVSHPATESKLEPLGADADSLDGLNVHGAIKDELHAWKTRDLWDIIDTASGARDQPLGVSTTTAGTSRNSIWWEQREAAIKLLEGREGFDNDEFFPLIYTLDDEDEWADESCWHKANPNLGVTIKVEELRSKCREAIRNPGLTNAFRRLRLNQPTESMTKWLPVGLLAAAWDDNWTEEHLQGRACYGGLDLSQTLDLTAWALVFPPSEDDPNWRILIRHFIPGHEIDEREKRDGFSYRKCTEGDNPTLTLTDGDWVDYDIVQARIVRDADRFRLMGLAYDRRFAPSFIQNLMKENIECHPWSQTFSGLNTGTKEFKRLLHAHLLKMNKCPLIEWQAENMVIAVDASGNERPDKGKATKRIDGLVATINALSLANHKYDEPVTAGVSEIDIERLMREFQ